MSSPQFGVCAYKLSSLLATLSSPQPNWHLHSLASLPSFLLPVPLLDYRLRILNCRLCRSASPLDTLSSPSSPLLFCHLCYRQPKPSSSQISISVNQCLRLYPVFYATKLTYRLCTFLCRLRRLASSQISIFKFWCLCLMNCHLCLFMLHFYFSISVPALFFFFLKYKSKLDF